MIGRQKRLLPALQPWTASWTRTRGLGKARRASSNSLHTSNEGPAWKRQDPSTAMGSALNSTRTSVRRGLWTRSRILVAPQRISDRDLLESSTVRPGTWTTRVRDDNRKGQFIDCSSRSGKEVIRDAQVGEYSRDSRSLTEILRVMVAYIERDIAQLDPAISQQVLDCTNVHKCIELQQPAFSYPLLSYTCGDPQNSPAKLKFPVIAQGHLSVGSPERNCFLPLSGTECSDRRGYGCS